MGRDWFRKLERELDAVTRRIGDMDVKTYERGSLMKNIAEIFFNIWIRFAVDLGTEMALTPWQWEVAVYEGKKHWHLREDFNFDAVDEIVLTDSKFQHDMSLRAEIYLAKKRERVRVVFRYFEVVDGEDAPVDHTVYDSTIRGAELKKIWNGLEPVVKLWFESHVRDDDGILLTYIKEREGADIGKRKGRIPQCS